MAKRHKIAAVKASHLKKSSKKRGRKASRKHTVVKA